MYLLFDIGGTTSRLASSFDGKTISETLSEPTPQDLNEAVKLYSQLASQLSQGQPIQGMAGGVAGPFSPDKTKLVNAPHLQGWINKPLVEKFSQIANCPIFFENDTAMAALGEANKGAGAGYNIVGYIAVGTGIGGARVVGGRIDANSIGFEPGHMIMAPGKSWENLISGSAISLRYNKPASELVDQAFWQEFLEYLVWGLNNLTVFWSPDVIILGGGVILQGQISVDQVMLELHKILRIFPKLPKISKASLGDHSAITGALVYLNEKLKTERT